MPSETTELRQRVDRLERRVSALERILDGRDELPSPAKDDALDSRDAAVVGALEHGESYTRLDLVHLYQNHTAIRSVETATERAKKLQNRDFFQKNNGRLTFRG